MIRLEQLDERQHSAVMALAQRVAEQPEDEHVLGGLDPAMVLAVAQTVLAAIQVYLALRPPTVRLSLDDYERLGSRISLATRQREELIEEVNALAESDPELLGQLKMLAEARRPTDEV